MNQAALNKVKENKEQGNKSLWRVSSTLFTQVRMDEVLEPMHQFCTAESMRKYPPTLCYEQVSDELKHIELL